MLPPEPSHLPTASPEYPNIPELQEKDFKRSNMKIIEFLKGEMIKSHKESKEITNS